MKTFIIFFSLMFNLAVASDESSFMIEGELQTIELNGQIVAHKIIAMGHEFYLSSPAKGEDRECLNGVYEVTSRNGESKSFQILQIHRCEPAVKNSNIAKTIFCPAVFMPVCGIPAEGGVPRTYGNSCELSRDGAKKLFDGECEKALNSLNIGAALNRFIK